MADSTTHLDPISASQSQKEVTANETDDAFSPAATFGRRANTTTALTWGYYGGRFTKADGTDVNIANGTVALSASTTNYVEADSVGALTKNTTGFSAGAIPLYTIVTGASTVTSYTDHRDGTQGSYSVRNRKRRVATMSFSATPTFNWSLYDVIRMTLAGNITSMTMTGAQDGQPCTLELTQDGTGSRTVAWAANVRWGVTVPIPTLTTTASKMDRLGFIYEGTATKYDGVAVAKGY